VTTTPASQPPSTLQILLGRAWAALDDLAEYQPHSLADVHALLTAVAGPDTPTGSLTDRIAEIIDRTGRSQHLTDLPDQGDLVQTCTAYYAGIVIDGEGGDVINEALAAIKHPWDARTSQAFLRAHHVTTDPDTIPTDADIDLLTGRALARLTTGGAQ
jgi:hypothetical protein